MKARGIRQTVAALAVMLSLSITPVVATVAIAQDASPEPGALLAGLGLPVLEVTVTPDGVELPTEVAAGPILLVGHNGTEGTIFIDALQFPEGVTIDDFLAFIESEDEGGVFPEWTADTVLAGGVEIWPGESGSVGIVLAPGEYSITVESETELASYEATFTVTGELAEDAVESVPVDLAIELGAYTFDFPDTVAAGPQIISATNTHEGILHHAIVVQTDRLYTHDEVIEGVIALFMGTPTPEGGFSLFATEPGFETPVISAGQTVWVEADLQPGFYVAICFVPDPGAEDPHLLHGMVDTFEVTE